MKKITSIALGILTACLFAGTAMAVDINSLDRVSVLMPKSEVISLIGEPDDVVELENGLKAEIYNVSGIAPMVGAGCIYGKDGRLAGQSFVFRGELDGKAAERLQKHGFTVLEDAQGNYRFLGKDDDTDQFLVATISLHNGMTVIMTFEKGFYDQQVK
jgi:hypothetical protein